MGWIAPIFLAGLGLLALPWLIHQIRRPDRDLLRFSSLMFLPKLDRRVIERRKVQHLLLMALRMLMLGLLALAFARPFARAPEGLRAGEGPERHVILIDRSYSMGTGNRQEQARIAAHKIVVSIGANDWIAVATFADRTKAVYLSTEKPEASADGKSGDAGLGLGAAIDSVATSEQGTDYDAALQFAQELLERLARSEEDEAREVRGTIHLISDFQLAGVAGTVGGAAPWRLAPGIRLETMGVGEESVSNLALADLAVKKQGEGELRIVGKIKNWSAENVEGLEVKLEIEGREDWRQEVSVASLHATQASFVLPLEGARAVAGRLRLPADDLAADNSRYFAWSEPLKKTLWIVGDRDDARENEGAENRWPAERILSNALGAQKGEVWELENVGADELGARLKKSAGPDLVILTGAAQLEEDALAKALEYTRKGGRLFALLNSGAAAEQLNAGLLGPLGLVAQGSRFDRPLEARFDLVDWVDFDHPIFFIFRGPRYNDFSQLRFFNRLQLKIAGAGQGSEGEGAARALARFEYHGEEVGGVAIAEAQVGRGKAVVWAFGLDLSENNVAKNIKFVPMLHETVAYLTDLAESDEPLHVGDVVAEAGTDIAGVQQWRGGGADGLGDGLGDGEWEAAELGLAGRYERAGLYRSKRANDDAWGPVRAMNVGAAESDPTPIGLEEFRIKFASEPPFATDGEAEAAPRELASTRRGVGTEYGPYILMLVFAFLAVECWYALRVLG